MKNVQISQELFMQLLRFHLVEDESCEREIKQELEKKLDRMVLRDLFGKSKTAPTQEEREQARKEYLDRQGRKGVLQMLKQPERESRNVNDLFYEMEGRRIQKMNEVLAGVELTKSEERTLIWLAGWEESTVDNLLSVISPIQNDRNIYMRPIRRKNQHQSFGKILQEKISWTLRRVAQQGNVSRGVSLSLHFPKVSFSIGQTMW